MLIIAILVSLSLVSCAVALTADSNVVQPPAGTSNAIGTQGTPATIGTVTYYVFSSGPVRKGVVNATNTIEIARYQLLLIQFKGKVSGNENTQKGGMFFQKGDSSITQAMLLTPTRWGTMMISSPISYPASGIYDVTLSVIAPNGESVTKTILINVS